MPQIDKFIEQRQTKIKAKHDKMLQHKSIMEMMEMSNLSQYMKNWGNKENKEKAPTCYMAALVCFFLKQEMSGAAPNIGNVADTFKISRSQLSRLITAKKFRSRPSSYVPKRRRMVAEDEPSVNDPKMGEEDEPEEDELEGYLLQ